MRSLQQLLSDKTIEYVNLRHKYAEQQTNAALSNGGALRSDNEGIVNWYNKFVAPFLFEVLWNGLYNAKLHGKVFLSLANTKDGTIKLNIALPMYNNKTAKILQAGKLAVLYTKPKDDDTGIVIEEIWDTEKVVRRGLYKGDEISLNGLYDSVTGEQIEKVWNHGLGFLPVFEIQNTPRRVFNIGATGKAQYTELKFDYGVEYLADEYNALKAVNLRAEVMTIPRYAGKFDQATLQKIQKDENGVLGAIMSDVLLQSNKTDKNGQAGGVEILQGQYYGNDRAEYLKGLEKNYAEGVGSSYQDTGSAISTATEIFYSNSLDEKTADKDIKLMESFIYQILDTLLVAKRVTPEINPEARDYVFELTGNKVLAEQDANAIIDQRLANGTMTRKDALIKLDNLTEDEAEQKLQEIEAEAEEQRAKMMEAITAIDGTQPDGGQDPNQPDNNNGVQ